jgi:hypothetical protein
MQYLEAAPSRPAFLRTFFPRRTSIDNHTATEPRTNHIGITTAAAGRSRKASQFETKVSEELAKDGGQAHKT